MTNKIKDLENQPQLEQESIKDLDQLRTLSLEEMSSIVGGVMAPKFGEGSSSPNSGGGSAVDPFSWFYGLASKEPQTNFGGSFLLGGGPAGRFSY